MHLMSRRTALLSAVRALPGATTSLSPDLAALVLGEANAAVPKRGIRPPYGAAINKYALAAEDGPAYRQALRTYCRLAVIEGGFLWENTRPAPDRFDYSYYQPSLDFAFKEGMPVRGGVLVWYAVMPKWTDRLQTAGDAERVLVQHLEKVVGDFNSRITDWTVVNEPIDEKVPAGAGAALRPSVWTRTLGERYIDIAFRTVAAISPSRRLTINEYAIEGNTDEQRRKLAAYLALIRRLVDRGVPLHCVGIQGHLDGMIPIDRDGVMGFVDAVKKLGLDVSITELDVVDQKLPADIELRDAAVALRAYELLDAVTAVAQPIEVFTWGIADSYTWAGTFFKRGDGLPIRPLPLDRAYKPKPLMRVIEQFCDTAGR